VIKVLPNTHDLRQSFTLYARHFTLTLGTQTKIMGIVNVTPDSFSRDGCLVRSQSRTTDAAFRRALALVRQGADFIDIGGESTRPGAGRVTAEEEARRIIPVIQKLTRVDRVPVSVDTYKPEVAQRALDAGASVVNNIRGAQAERALLRMIKRYEAAVVLMHMRGTPRTMQRHTDYRDIIQEITASLRKSVEICLEIGIKSDKIIVDPGIGFGKTAEQNLTLLKGLPEFRDLSLPILIGTSRKSFIGKALNRDVQQRAWGTAATVTASIIHGAHIVRVHDVKAMRDVAVMTDAIMNQRFSVQ